MLTRLWKFLLVPVVFAPHAIASPYPEVVRTGGLQQTTPVISLAIDNAMNEADIDAYLDDFRERYLPVLEADEIFAAYDPTIIVIKGKYAATRHPAHTYNERYDMAWGGYIQVNDGVGFENPSQFFEGEDEWSYPGPSDRNPDSEYQARNRTGAYHYGYGQGGATIGNWIPGYQGRRQFLSGVSHDAGHNRQPTPDLTIPLRCNYNWVPVNIMILPDEHTAGGWFGWNGRSSDPQCVNPDGWPYCGVSLLMKCDGTLNNYSDKCQYGVAAGKLPDGPQVMLWVLHAALADRTDASRNHLRALDGTMTRVETAKAHMGFVQRGIDPPAFLELALVDINSDGACDSADLGMLLTEYGERSRPGQLLNCDLNNDYTTDSADLAIMLQMFGR